MRTAILLSIAAWLAPAFGQANKGYYRNPALSGSTVVFVAEGDLWQVPLQGGVARRLTSHPALEANPRFSPDGKTLAFNANYEGVNEIYTMPAEGGLPQRRSSAAVSPSAGRPTAE